MLALWGIWTTTLLPSLPGLLEPGVVSPDRALSMGQIKFNCVPMLNWTVWNRTVYMDKMDLALYNLQWHPMSAQSWWLTNTGMSMCRSLLSSFCNSIKSQMFVLLGWFLRWEVSGCTTAVLWIYSKQHATSLCSSQLFLLR